MRLKFNNKNKIFFCQVRNAFTKKKTRIILFRYSNIGHLLCHLQECLKMFFDPISCFSKQNSKIAQKKNFRKLSIIKIKSKNCVDSVCVYVCVCFFFTFFEHFLIHHQHLSTKTIIISKNSKKKSNFFIKFKIYF